MIPDYFTNLMTAVIKVLYLNSPNTATKLDALCDLESLTLTFTLLYILPSPSALIH